MQSNPSPELVYTAVASAGGIAKYLNEYIKTDVFNWKFLIANIVVSGFSGYMFASFGLFLGLEIPVAYSLAGMGGFMGSRAIDFIEDFIRAKTIKSNES